MPSSSKETVLTNAGLNAPNGRRKGPPASPALHEQGEFPTESPALPPPEEQGELPLESPTSPPPEEQGEAPWESPTHPSDSSASTSWETCLPAFSQAPPGVGFVNQADTDSASSDDEEAWRVPQWGPSVGNPEAGPILGACPPRHRLVAIRPLTKVKAERHHRGALPTVSSPEELTPSPEVSGRPYDPTHETLNRVRRVLFPASPQPASSPDLGPSGPSPQPGASKKRRGAEAWSTPPKRRGSSMSWWSPPLRVP
ncbi:leucine-rich repeat extensin-like protein 5 [Fopius arisanus]|uniref:Leucine-rich repeat extensin-like protein 5 n=1 Tax=Fopius arisanus TaxID=64838 RepID=A0A9R1TN59_9HYME|nr:PREDICTED: leucine-rich repeat extensin-like protein 5 [Fopius arisanus]